MTGKRGCVDGGCPWEREECEIKSLRRAIVRRERRGRRGRRGRRSGRRRRRVKRGRLRVGRVAVWFVDVRGVGGQVGRGVAIVRVVGGWRVVFG